MSEMGLDSMDNAGDKIGYYVVDLDDERGDEAQGPYAAEEATWMAGADQRVVTAAELQAMRAPPAAPAPPAAVAPVMAELQKATRSWGWSLLVMAVIQVVVGGFGGAPWAILMIVLGLASFFYQSSALFVLYGVMLAWAAVSNVLTGQIGWIGFGLLQVYWTVSIFRRFRRFRQAEDEMQEALGADQVADRAARVFPWASGLVGGLSLVVFVGTFIFAILAAALSETPSYWEAAGFVIGLAASGAVLGFALGLASLLCRHPYRAVSVIGMVAGALTVVVQLVIHFLAGS